MKFMLELTVQALLHLSLLQSKPTGQEVRDRQCQHCSDKTLLQTWDDTDSQHEKQILRYSPGTEREAILQAGPVESSANMPVMNTFICRSEVLQQIISS